MLPAGSLAGTGLRAVTAAARSLRARVIAACWPGMRAFLAAAVIPGLVSSAARSRSAVARVFSALRTAALAWSRAGLRVSLVFSVISAR